MKRVFLASALVIALASANSAQAQTSTTSSSSSSSSSFSLSNLFRTPSVTGPSISSSSFSQNSIAGVSQSPGLFTRLYRAVWSPTSATPQIGSSTIPTPPTNSLQMYGPLMPITTGTTTSFPIPASNSLPILGPAAPSATTQVIK